MKDKDCGSLLIELDLEFSFKKIVKFDVDNLFGKKCINITCSYLYKCATLTALCYPLVCIVARLGLLMADGQDGILLYFHLCNLDDK